MTGTVSPNVKSPTTDDEGLFPLDAFASINTVSPVPTHVVVISGSPSATEDNDWSFIFEVLNRAHRTRPITLIVTTGRKGAEATAQEWAELNNVRVAQYLLTDAEWKRDGNSAGPKRYARMLKEQNPDVVIGFSKVATDSGTNSLLNMASERYNLTTHLFDTALRVRDF